MRVGLMVPSVNTITEAEFHDGTPAGVTVHTARMAIRGTAADDVREMVARALPQAARDVADTRPDVVVLACTAVGGVFGAEGEARIINDIEKITNAPVVSMNDAVKHALTATGAERVAVVTPYPDDVTDSIVDELRAQGLVVPCSASMGYPDAFHIAAIEPDALVSFVESHVEPGDADALFLSCGNLRTMEASVRLAKTLGGPVVASNLATLDATLEALGIGWMVTTLAEYELLVDGNWQAATAGRTLISANPATGEPWAEFADADAADVDHAVKAARRAFEGPWGALTASDRGALLFEFARLLEHEAPRIAEIESRDCGKLLVEAAAQAAALPRWYRFFGGLADKLDGRVPSFDFPTVLNYITREPVGVVAALSSWDSPAMLSTCKLAPALAAGNTVVLKPSEMAPASVVELARLFERVGFPAGAVNVVTGGANCGEALVSHSDIDHVSFTGGPATARTIAAAAARNLTPTSFELGGKSANIVFADAQLAAAIPGVVAGIFAAAGQTCVAGSRALVHREIYDSFLDELTRRIAAIRLGAPDDPATQVGPIVDERQLARIAELVDGARAEGARIVIGGARATVDDLPGGCFFAPTVLTGVKPDMRIAQEEVFGPVLVVMPFDNDDEAVALANSTRYSLNAGVWTNDVRRAHRVARRLRAGTVWVNTYRTMSPLAPHGGWGLSGHGRENGIEAVDPFLAPKSVWVELSNEVRDPFSVRLG